MKTSVYALEALNEDFHKREVDIDSPDDDEVLVKIVASGLCHSDLNVVNGISPMDLPAVVGHEGAGVVQEVGKLVKGIKPGDKVMLCWTHCGRCEQCDAGERSLCEHWPAWNLFGKRPNGKKTWSDGKAEYSNFLSQGSFGQHVLVQESGVIKVNDDADLVALAGGIGCGILTGAGTVFNTFHGSRVGSSIAVFGVGAVGAGCIMAARSGHYSKIIAIDLHPARLQIAKEIGATHVINGRDSDVVAQIQALGGVDYAVEATGVPKVMEDAYASLKRAGTVAIVGIAPRDKKFALPISDHMQFGRKVIGVALGSAHPKTFIPFLIELYEQGRLPIDKLCKTFPISQINEAVQAMKDGTVIKPVVVF
ncbi:Zn-dependent alcohol dehydrogenase, class III [Cystobasidium minutum MCA 4210]|uniref:Zn-dependent alcohol dehydrogenase, class III n=1 Tax=Cystobasidium minutum MCA 4210 TaxID=1397322 RepID=UPI0034D01D75|eukprot:jgi/Rhomi1/62443/CE62442_883